MSAALILLVLCAYVTVGLLIALRWLYANWALLKYTESFIVIPWFVFVVVAWPGVMVAVTIEWWRGEVPK